MKFSKLNELQFLSRFLNCFRMSNPPQQSLIFTLYLHGSQFKSHVAILAKHLTSGLPSHRMSHQPGRGQVPLAGRVCPSERQGPSQAESEGGLSATRRHHPGCYKKNVECRLGLTVGRTLCLCTSWKG